MTVKGLFKSYPQAMFYVFKVVESDVTLKMSKVRESKLFKALKTYIEQNNHNLNAFAESLDCLVDPELRWKYWFDLIREAMVREDYSSREQASRFASLMMENIAHSKRKYVEKRIGEFNRRFANELGRDIIDAFGQNGRNLLNISYNEFVRLIREIYDLINKR